MKQKLGSTEKIFNDRNLQGTQGRSFRIQWTLVPSFTFLERAWLHRNKGLVCPWRISAFRCVRHAIHYGTRCRFPKRLLAIMKLSSKVSNFFEIQSFELLRITCSAEVSHKITERLIVLFLYTILKETQSSSTSFYEFLTFFLTFIWINSFLLFDKTAEKIWNIS